VGLYMPLLDGQIAKWTIKALSFDAAICNQLAIEQDISVQGLVNYPVSYRFTLVHKQINPNKLFRVLGQCA